MLVTEQEAAAKTCPQSIGKPERFNAGGGIVPGGSFACLGSGCMAWRWGGVRYTPFGSRPVLHRGEVWVNAIRLGNLPAANDGVHDPLGYCGLSERPE